MTAEPISIDIWAREHVAPDCDDRPTPPLDAYKAEIEREVIGSTPSRAEQRAGGIPPEAAQWPDPDPRLLTPTLPPAPPVPLEATFSPSLVRWFRQAAEAKAAPVDYVVLSVLSCVGSLMGNTRWASPWSGWTEPPIIWGMAIGQPSSNKSPGLDPALSAVKKIERNVHRRMAKEIAEWDDKNMVAEVAEKAWKEDVKAAIKGDKDLPPRPEAANPGPQPIRPRLIVSDVTVERLAMLASKQSRGPFVARDELAGWLHGMTRYSKGGSDRPFWIEAYGGRSFAQERMGRESVKVDRLSISVVGCIQPDRLKSLLFNEDDDGLLARFLPVWPDPAPIRRPTSEIDEMFLENVFEVVAALKMDTDQDGGQTPRFVPFSEEARERLTQFRIACRNREDGAEGLLLSFIGKLPGMAIRLALIFAYLEYGATRGDEPTEITLEQFSKAVLFVENYGLPMAYRAYADASAPKEEKAARRLVGIIKEQGWDKFSTRELQRLGITGLTLKAEIDPVLSLLGEADVIRNTTLPANPRGGRRPRYYEVNPALGDME